MKNSTFLIPTISTILFAFGNFPATAAIPTNDKITPNGNNQIAGGVAGDIKDGADAFGQPIREMADPYFNNVWYASLYPNVKQDIDNNYFGGNRINRYIRICRTIADNKGLTFSAAIWSPNGEVRDYLANRLVLVVKEENGVVNCYQRVPQFPN